MCSQSYQSNVVLSEWQGLSASSSLEDVLTDQYRVLRDIGQGSFATVKLARHIQTGTEVAVKVLQRVGWNSSFTTSEVDTLKAVEHPHIVQLFQVIETPGHVYLVMEYVAGGPLLQYIPTEVGMQEEVARRVFRQVVSAMCYCHKEGIVHRDLKVENVLVDPRGSVKLCDFGLACRFTAGQKFNAIHGTLAYWAPEMFRWQEYEGPAVDVWSLGVLLFLMVTGYFPFNGATFVQVKKQVLQASYHLPSHMSTEVRSLISQMLTVEPTQRPTVDQIMWHPWLSQAEESLPRPSTGPLPRHPDPSILLAMLELGYDPQDTCVSLATRQFDQAMATYLLLQLQKTQGAAFTVHPKPVQPQVGPSPSLSDPSSFSLGPRRSASQPALSSFPLLPREHQLPQEDEPSGQRGSRSASLPTLPLCGLPASTSTPSLPSLQSCCWLSSSGWEADSQFSLALSSEQSSLYMEPPPGGSTGCTHDKAKGWRRVARRTAACLPRICCCVQVPETGPGHQMQVAAVQGQTGPRPANRSSPSNAGPARRRFRNKVAPMEAPS